MAEKEYIERGALLDDIESAMKNGGMGCVVAQTMKRYIKRVPAADVVEVVRCEKCKHYLEPYCVRGVKERYGLVCVERTDFCSRGERSENVEV